MTGAQAYSNAREKPLYICDDSARLRRVSHRGAGEVMATVRITPLGFALTAALLAVGCVPEGPGPTGGFKVLTTQPPDGAAAVPEAVQPLILFSQPLDDREFEVTLQRGNTDRETLWCFPAEEGMALTCPPEEPLLPDKMYLLRVDVGLDGEYESETRFSTALPRGPAYDIGEGLAVEKVGDSEYAPGLLSSALVDDGTMVLVFNEFKLTADALPSEGYVLLGRGYHLPRATQEGEVVADGTYGYTISAPGEVQTDGGFLAQADYAYLPLSIGGEPWLLMMRQLEIRGHVDVEGGLTTLPEAHGEAWIPAEALDELLEVMPEWAAWAADYANLVAPDVDTDLDGEPDACMLRFLAHGDRVSLIAALDDDR